jgi:hypothetical protein
LGILGRFVIFLRSDVLFRISMPCGFRDDGRALFSSG